MKVDKQMSSESARYESPSPVLNNQAYAKDMLISLPGNVFNFPADNNTLGYEVEG